MEAFLLYILKSSILLAIFYLVYYVLLRKNTFFTVNRHFLLTGILFSLVLPFVEFTFITFIDQPDIYLIASKQNSPINEVSTKVNWWLIGFITYLLGVFVFSIRFAIQLISLFKLIQNHNYSQETKFKFVQVQEDISPFSFFNYIVYNPKLHSSQELSMILKHEKVHVTQNHTLDIIITNLFLIFQWINPIVWFYKKSTEQNLEFIADRETINQVNSKKEYFMTLVSVSSNNYSTITNNFYQSLIKKRIVMLNKQNSQKKQLWKIAIVIPLLSLFLWSFNTNEIVKIKENNTTTSSNATKGDKKIIKFKITKSSSKKDLNRIKDTFKDEYDVDIKFSNIQRNTNNEIIGIMVNVSSKKSNANYSLQNESPIQSFVILYNSKTYGISIGQSDHINSISIREKGKDQILEVYSDNNKQEYIVSNNNGSKTVKIKDKDGKIIREEVHGPEEGYFKINTKDKKTYAFFNDGAKKDPLFFIDGKESSKEEMENLDTENIESMNVYKGKKAEKKYGKKGENGVIEVKTKK
ncbi:M56 family metallopeptidase [Aquimarina aggregata]|uniref:M56 family metallopeptidase n=1 Tax=Aquimarina aggregata TaxID=1642818 RepID=UPI00248F7369|nr:M56 family metallopeptidase [Aquimarina aggregata]